MFMLKRSWWVALKVYEQGSDQNDSYCGKCTSQLGNALMWQMHFSSRKWPMQFSYVKCTNLTNALLICEMHWNDQYTSHLTNALFICKMYWSDPCISHTVCEIMHLLYQKISFSSGKFTSHIRRALLIWVMHLSTEKCTFYTNSGLSYLNYSCLTWEMQ